jgi:hypothetical protein
VLVGHLDRLPSGLGEQRDRSPLDLDVLDVDLDRKSVV